MTVKVQIKGPIFGLIATTLTFLVSYLWCSNSLECRYALANDNESMGIWFLVFIVCFVGFSTASNFRKNDLKRNKESG